MRAASPLRGQARAGTEVQWLLQLPAVHCPHAHHLRQTLYLQCHSSLALALLRRMEAAANQGLRAFLAWWLELQRVLLVVQLAG